MGVQFLPSQVTGQVVEGRVYGIWRDQEWINKFYWRIEADTIPGPGSLENQIIAIQMQTNWQASLAPIVPPDFKVRQYWAATIHSVVAIVGPPRRWVVSYVDQTIVLADLADVGTSTDLEWMTPIDAATMNRFGEIRNKNWRSNIRVGPVSEDSQNKGLMTDPAITLYNTAYSAFAFNPFTPSGTYDVIAINTIFSPALAVGKTQIHMEDACQNISEWRVSRLVGTQRTRKVRAAGY